MKLADRQSYPPHLFIYNLLYPPHCVLISRTVYKDRIKVGHHRLFHHCPLIYHSLSPTLFPLELKLTGLYEARELRHLFFRQRLSQ